MSPSYPLTSGRGQETPSISLDPKDVPYVALAMATATPLLTGDKKLIDSPGKKIKILTLNEAVRLV